MKLFKYTWDNYLLIEGRENDVAKKYPLFSSVSYEGMTVIKYLSENDPSGNNKYLMWMADRFAEDFNLSLSRFGWEMLPDAPFKQALLKKHKEKRIQNHPTSPPDVSAPQVLDVRPGLIKAALHKIKYPAPQDYAPGPSITKPSRVINLFHGFVPYLQKKDIYSYKSYEEIEDAIRIAKTKKEQIDAKKALKNAAKEGGRIIWENGDIAVIRPLTVQASCLFGKQTRWCVSAEDSENAFSQYTEEGAAFYFFFLPHHPVKDYKKVAVIIKDGRVGVAYDANDNMLRTYEISEDVWDEYPDEYRQGKVAHDEWLAVLDEILDLCLKDAKKDPPSAFYLWSAKKILHDHLLDSSATGEESIRLFNIKLSKGQYGGLVDATAHIEWEFKIKPKLVQKEEAWRDAVRKKMKERLDAGEYGSSQKQSYYRVRKGERSWIKDLHDKEGEFEDKIANHVYDLVEERLDKIRAEIEAADKNLVTFRPGQVSSFQDYGQDQGKKIEVVITTGELENASFNNEEEFRQWLTRVSYLESQFAEYLKKTGEVEGYYQDYDPKKVVDMLFYSAVEEAGIASERASEETMTESDLFNYYGQN